MKRCVSICKGTTEEDCNDPCVFVGKKYCRLASQYKMDPPGCEVIKKDKTKKVNIQSIAKTKKRVTLLEPRTLKSRSPLSSNAPNRLVRSWRFNPETAARTIQSFMKKTEGKRKARFYGTICSDSGACIALGTEKDQLLTFFKFDTFEHAKEFTPIGVESVNGFLKEVTYEREGYTAHAILKSSAQDGADSLAYEYLIGMFINGIGKRFPCFVETYGLYHYPNKTEREEMKTKDRLVKKLIPLDPQNIRDVCRKARNICTLIQHIQHARSFSECYKEDYFRDHESAYVYYQVFFTLHQLRTQFTHYDLHRNNVLLYEPVVGKYIQYHYHLPDKVVRYKSKYLVKIIDYGRSFFPGALEYHQKICAEKACNPLCGFSKGFSTFFEDRRVEIVFGGANTLYKNESHDLIFLYESLDHLTYLQKTVDPEYTQILQDTLYNQGISTRRGQWGTMEDLRHDTKIRNVTDAYQRWETYILKRTERNDQAHAGMTCLGDIHVYLDKEVEYIPFDPTKPATKTKTRSRPRPQSKTRPKTVQGIRI
jgi:hypothetical protein